MADDLVRQIEEDEAEAYLPLFEGPECVVDFQKSMADVGFGDYVKVDNPAAVSVSLVRKLAAKCTPLRLQFVSPLDPGSKIPGRGQGGFIRKQAIQNSPDNSAVEKYSVVPVTAKHNLRLVQGFTTITAQLQLPGVNIDVNSPDLNWIPTDRDHFQLRAPNEQRARSCVSLWGVDVSVGRVISNPISRATMAGHSFAQVRKTFKLKEGQKVGIAVKFDEESKPNAKRIQGAFETSLALDEARIQDIYGKPGVVNIYTGEIAYVGTHHIEYNFNSFSGCSGAVVFLLDVDQPDDGSMQECDYGTAVAIHSGAHPIRDFRNYGFMLHHHPELAY
jgi:hypothetical protein